MTRNTVEGLLAMASGRLSAAGVDHPLREARLLLGHALGLDATGLFRLERTATVDAEPFERLLARRCGREPMAFLLSRCGFWSLDLAVSADTLIPRADSEAVVEAVLRAIPDRSLELRVLDLGTGTGCLLLAVLAEYGNADGIGVDLSPGATALARSNARSNDLGDRASFLCADWGDAIEARFDLVLSNPPYIPADDLAGLMPEVQLFEPSRALDGGRDGLSAYRVLVPRLQNLLRPGGLAVFEVGIGQAGEVGALASAAGLDICDIGSDLGGVERAITLRDAGGEPARQKSFGRTGHRG